MIVYFFSSFDSESIFPIDFLHRNSRKSLKQPLLRWIAKLHLIQREMCIISEQKDNIKADYFITCIEIMNIVNILILLTFQWYYMNTIISVLIKYYYLKLLLLLFKETCTVFLKFYIFPLQHLSQSKKYDNLNSIKSQ